MWLYQLVRSFQPVCCFGLGRKKVVVNKECVVSVACLGVGEVKAMEKGHVSALGRPASEFSCAARGWLLPWEGGPQVNRASWLWR